MNEQINEKPKAPTNEPFVVKDCALIAIATGVRAQNLRELRMHLATIDPGCIYYHFWGGLLRPRFDDPEYQNDFAAWAHHGLHDRRLAERLALVDPTENVDMEDLRRELLEVIEEREDESEMVPWARADQQFHFIRSQIVVFDTGARIIDPRDLVELIPTLPVSSIFFHFVDARRRDPVSMDDFSTWLMGFEGVFPELMWHVAALDPYFGSLSELREELAGIFANYFKGK